MPRVTARRRSRERVRGLTRGAPLAPTTVMRLGLMAYVIWLGVISCGGAAIPVRPAITTPCSVMRVGKVAVTGAPSSQVAALAVLEGTIDDRTRTDRIVAVAAERLRALGYARAQIAVTRKPGCFTDLDVAVALGPKFKIQTIDFATSDQFPARDRLAVIEDALGTVNTIGGIYVEYRLARALTRLQERYRDAGWLDAKIAPPIARYGDASIAITIPITPGPRFKISAVRARGAGAKVRAAVLDEIRIEPGSWYDGLAIRNGIERARRKLDRRVELRTIVSHDAIELELETDP
jgi:outer membrane protein assembly factor BamA